MALVLLRAPKATFVKTPQRRLFPEILTQLLEIIHRPMCEQFHVGTMFFLPNYTCQPYPHKQGSVHLVMDEKLANWANKAS